MVNCVKNIETFNNAYCSCRLVAIMGFAAFFLDLVFLEETYPPVILISKAAELRRRTKNWGIHARQEEIELDFSELISKNFSRPMRLLVTEPIGKGYPGGGTKFSVPTHF